MASALYTDVKRKGNKSVFTRYNHPIVLYEMYSRGISTKAARLSSQGLASPECMAMTQLIFLQYPEKATIQP